MLDSNQNLNSNFSNVHHNSKNNIKSDLSKKKLIEGSSGFSFMKGSCKKKHVKHRTSKTIIFPSLKEWLFLPLFFLYYLYPCQIAWLMTASNSAQNARFVFYRLCWRFFNFLRFRLFFFFFTLSPFFFFVLIFLVQVLTLFQLEVDNSFSDLGSLDEIFIRYTVHTFSLNASLNTIANTKHPTIVDNPTIVGILIFFLIYILIIFLLYQYY